MEDSPRETVIRNPGQFLFLVSVVYFVPGLLTAVESYRSVSRNVHVISWTVVDEVTRSV